MRILPTSEFWVSLTRHACVSYGMCMNIGLCLCVHTNWDSLPAQHSIDRESTGSVRRRIDHPCCRWTPSSCSTCIQWHYCLYAQERPAGIFCSVNTNNTKPMYKVGKVTHAALNNELCLSFHMQWHAGMHDDNEHWSWVLILLHNNMLWAV